MRSHQGSIAVHVKPGSKAPGLSFGADGTIVVRVRERAIEGRANDAVRSALAALLGVPRSTVSLVRGAGSKHKAFTIEGFSADEVRRRIEMGAPAQPKPR